MYPSDGIREITDDGWDSQTDFEVVDRLVDGTALLRVTPLTGRTNQIRLHLWYLGFPIVGDPVWLQNGKTGPSRTLTVDEPAMCLHAWLLSLEHTDGTPRTFTAPEPSWWKCVSGTGR